ncbi:hypothetical protein ONZ45_g14890 [Pleurotus djamor]|nr:hypothetical protein ONZ45_g14890 [Pleurotus djamor]
MSSPNHSHSHSHHHHHHHHTHTHSQQAPGPEHDYVAANIQHFNDNAQKFEQHPYAKEGTERQTIAFLGGYPFDCDKTVMMDFACGPGLVAMKLLNYTKKIVGVDISQGLVDSFNKRVNEARITPDMMQAVCVQLKGVDGELDGQKFDVITCGLAYHHIPDIEETTKMLSFFLKPGGALLVTEMLKEDGVTPDFGGADIPVQHIVAHKGGFKEEEFRRVFEAAGLVFEMTVMSRGRHHKFPAKVVLVKGTKPIHLTSLPASSKVVDVPANLRQLPSFPAHKNHTNAPGWDGIKHQKYPDKNPDKDVFEAPKLDYASIPAGTKWANDTSPAALLQLVRDGQLEEAEQLRTEFQLRGISVPPNMAFEAMVIWSASRSENDAALEGWLSLLPTAKAVGELSFPLVEKQLLAKASPASLGLVMLVGTTCASKGHRNFVRDAVLPVFQQIAEPAVYRGFLRQLVVKLREYDGKSARLRSHATAYLVESVPSIQQQPAGVFEDLSDEYLYTSVSSSATSPTTSPDAIIALINSDCFEEADHLLTEAQDLGIHIPHSLVYEKAALNAIDRYLMSSDQLTWFAKWFSLIPTVAVSGRREFPAIRKRLFAAPATNLMLIMRFGLICATKGYAHNVARWLLPPLVRYADAEVSIQFLKDFEAAHQQYCEVHPFEPIKSEMRNSRNAFRSVAIRSLAIAGREEFALKLLPSAESIESNDALPIADDIHKLLVNRLRARDDLPVDDILLQIRSSFASACNNVQQPAPRPNLSTGDTTDIACDIRSLKSAIRDGSLPHIRDIVSILSRYLSTGRTRALTLLRNKALRSGPHIAQRFLFVEIMCYYRRRQYDKILLTFYSHFFLTGLPRDLILARLHNLDTFHLMRQSDPLNDWYSKNPKHYPSPYHCSMVWHALVRQARYAPRKDTDILYDKFIRYAKGLPSEDQALLSSFGVGVFDHALPPPPSWKHRVDDSAFVPFMRAFGIRYGPARSARVLQDMVTLGIRPTLYHYTDLAGTYAKLGDEKRAFMILKRLESDNMLSDAIPTTEETEVIGNTFASEEADEVTEADEEDVNPSSSPPNPPLVTFPPPNLVFLTSMLRGFLASRAVDSATRVVEYIESKYPSDGARDPTLEIALQAYHQLLESGPQESTIGQVKEGPQVKVMTGSLANRLKYRTP